MRVLECGTGTGVPPNFDTTAPLPFTGLGSYAARSCQRLHKVGRKVGIDVWKRASRIQLGINIRDFLSDFGISGHRSTSDLCELRACAVNKTNSFLDDWMQAGGRTLLDSLGRAAFGSFGRLDSFRLHFNRFDGWL